MSKQDNRFGKRIIAFVTSLAFVAGALGVSVALAAITFSNTSIVGDSSFNTITGVTPTTWDLGSGNTLSLQTISNGAIFLGGVVSSSNNILFAPGKGIDSSVAGTLLIGNSTTTGITIGRSGQIVAFPGTVTSTGSILFAGGVGIDSVAAGTLLIGNSTTTGITIGRGGQLVGFPGVISVGTTTQSGTAGLTVSSIDTSSTLAIGNTNATRMTLGRSGQIASFAGHANATGTVPSVGTCGAGPTIVGTDNASLVTVGGGTAVIACTVTFANVFTNKPVCTISATNTSTPLFIQASSTASTFSFNSFATTPTSTPQGQNMGAVTFAVTCMGID